MKKRVLSVVLVCVLSVSGLLMPAHAQSAYPESAHNYADNACETWEYVYPEKANGLYITFSEDTVLDSRKYYDFVPENASKEDLEDFKEYGSYYSGGDYLEIYDANGECCYELYNDDAAGETYFISGDRFKITLHTDFANTAYGFRVTDVKPHREGYSEVIYKIDDMTVAESFPVGDCVEMKRELCMRQFGNRMIVGWKTEDGRAYTYDNTSLEPWYERNMTDIIVQEGECCTLTPIWCPIALRKEEVFSFLNSTDVFNADVNGYLFTRSQFMRILPNWIATFALSPIAPLAALVCTVFLFIWPTLPFIGSCCGFAIGALLQHYGKIDLLSEQGVSSLCELEPDDQIQSTINYYNIHAAAVYPVNHIALQPGTKEYSVQLHALYDTVAGGTPVYFELYGRNQHPLRMLLTRDWSNSILDSGMTAHGVVITGAYTDLNGNHILIAYDNNSYMYAEGYCDILYIDPDFTTIYSEYGDDDVLDGFSWNEELTQFDSFKTKGVSNPFAWHKQFWKNAPSLFRQLVELFKTME